MSNPGQQSPNYGLVARALWDLTVQRQNFSSQVNADYGKWLIITITSTHLAGIYLVSQPTVPAEVRLDAWSYWPFVIGICAILFCGLVTWANWALCALLWADWLKPMMLVDANYWPGKAKKWMTVALPVTFYLPLAIGLASAACIPWAAYNILTHIKAKEPPAPICQPAKPVQCVRIDTLRATQSGLPSRGEIRSGDHAKK